MISIKILGILMPTFSLAVPSFSVEVETVLMAKGCSALSQQVSSALIERCTHHPDDDAAYIYFVRPTPSAHFAKLAAQVAETLVFYDERGFNVDVDHDGHLFGIELLGRADVVSRLQVANAL
jgi:uncharacterized protein YuzE